MRLGGRDHFINRLGRWDELVAVARAQSVSERIWSDATAGILDGILNRYGESVDAATGTEMPSRASPEFPLVEVLRVKGERRRQAEAVVDPCPSQAVEVWSTTEDCCRGGGVSRMDAVRRIE